MNNIKVVGVVILYNPELDLLNNIYTYLPHIDLLYVVDNSETPNKNISFNVSKIKYISFGDNQCISYPLNYVANMAYSAGYNFIDNGSR